MASSARRLPTNIEGPFFVDDSCIDCDTCRWMAPEVFTRRKEQACVWRQPVDATAERRALWALIACPTGSIGTKSAALIGAARRDFPLAIDSVVSHCGYHHRDSFGAASYFLRRSEGNIMVDTPRWNAQLARKLDELGGVAWLFLTHRDDVAEHERWQRHFGCRRIMHVADLGGSLPRVEVPVTGIDPVRLAPDLTIIPVPGHTAGSLCLLHDDCHLFTGDHLAWSPRRGHLYAFRNACWYSWPELVRSMRRLAQHSFTWVLPGHGRRIHFSAPRMRREMERCLAWLDRVSRNDRARESA